MLHTFFELIQVALGQRQTLSLSPSPEEWQELFRISKKHGLMGIAYHGVEQLPDQGSKPPRELLLKWFAACEKIRKRNTMMNARSKELLERLQEAGFRPTILKGQGIARYYDVALQDLRLSGDIDVYVNCNREDAIAYAKSQGQEKVNWDYKHLHLKIWKNTAVELHYHPEIMLNLIKNRKLQSFFRQNEEQLFHEDGELITPTVTMNVFYVLLHIYRHFHGSGIGLRQLVDYYYVLRTANGDFGSFSHHKSIDDILKRFGMFRFAKGMMWVLQEMTGLGRQYMFCDPLESEGRFILNEISVAGNLGRYDKRYVVSEKFGKFGEMISIIRHSSHLLIHYPSDAIMAPVWYAWHKCWMLKNIKY
jgi:hypothetical protein